MTANMYSLATYCSCLSQVRSLKLNKRHLLLYIAFRFVYKSGLEFTCLHCFTFVNSGSFVMKGRSGHNSFCYMYSKDTRNGSCTCSRGTRKISFSYSRCIRNTLFTFLEVRVTVISSTMDVHVMFVRAANRKRKSVNPYPE